MTLWRLLHWRLERRMVRQLREQHQTVVDAHRSATGDGDCVWANLEQQP